TPSIYTLSLHDALPIYVSLRELVEPSLFHSNRVRPGLDEIEDVPAVGGGFPRRTDSGVDVGERHLSANDHSLTRIGHVALYHRRSEEHTSELQSRENLV